MSEVKKLEIGTAINALKFLIQTLEKYHFRWVITGGFASLVYGVKRPLTDIDIDIETSKNSYKFQDFLKELEPHTSQPLEHFIDQNYNNYNFEINYQGQVIDICPMAEMDVFNKASGKYENFYKSGFPKTEIVDFHGLKLPLLSKEMIIKNKEMLVSQRKSDLKDIEGLRKLLKP